MEFKGWIKLYRGLLGSRVWQEKPFSEGQAWVDLLLRAEYQDEDRGTLYTSYRELGEFWGWGKNKVKAQLEKWVEDEMIELASINTRIAGMGTVVTIINYEKYQGEKEARDKLRVGKSTVLPTSTGQGEDKIRDKIQDKASVGKSTVSTFSRDKERDKFRDKQNKTLPLYEEFYKEVCIRKGETQTYGTLNNVCLTEDEYNNIVSTYERPQELLNNVSIWLANNPRDNHYAVVLTFVKNDKWEKRKVKVEEPKEEKEKVPMPDEVRKAWLRK